jgi:hypothetical protein
MQVSATPVFNTPYTLLTYRHHVAIRLWEYESGPRKTSPHQASPISRTVSGPETQRHDAINDLTAYIDNLTARINNPTIRIDDIMARNMIRLDGLAAIIANPEKRVDDLTNIMRNEKFPIKQVDNLEEQIGDPDEVRIEKVKQVDSLADG